jgi:ABC-2 type transport system ATP-binding protein
MNALLEVKHLVKKYKKLTAVDDVSFAIQRGICFGLLGPNGAGKTTTIEVIEDVILPTSGEITYKGKPRSASFKDEVGIQFQSTALLSFLTVWRNSNINITTKFPAASASAFCWPWR